MMAGQTWSRGAALAAAVALVAGFPASAAAQPARGPEHFTVIVNGNAPQQFIARGTIDATGTAVPVIRRPDGGVDQVRLPGGTFALTLRNASGGHSHHNPVTCVDTFDGTGNSTISDGTGSFAGIAGSGSYTFHLVFFETRTAQGCSRRGTVFDTVHDHGTVTAS